MAGYIGIPLETDSDKLTAQALGTLIENIPGYVPQEGHLEVWIIEVVARMVAEARDVASAVPTSIFRYFGESLLGLPPISSAAARTVTDWTMIDDQGYTIPSGTVVAFRTAGDEIVPFQTVEETVVNPGSLTHTGVVIEAIEPGSDSNGLGPGDVELVDAFSFVDSVQATETTSGGVDAETDDAYLDRLTAELQLLAPRPILAQDFAVFARRVPGVHRALAIDGYNPTDSTTNNERMVAVAVVAEDGGDLSQAVKDDVSAYLESLREVNFIVHVVGPSYTSLAIHFEAVTYPNADPIAVRTDAVDAVKDFLDPGIWGGGDESPPVWRESRTVRYLEIATVLNNVPGLDYLTVLTLNGGTDDVVMAGVAPLPATTNATEPTIITGVVTSP